MLAGVAFGCVVTTAKRKERRVRARQAARTGGKCREGMMISQTIRRMVIVGCLGGGALAAGACAEEVARRQARAPVRIRLV